MADKKNKRIVIRVTEEEHDKFHSLSTKVRKPVSRMVRDLVLDRLTKQREVKSDLSQKQVEELILQLSRANDEIAKARAANNRLGANLNQLVRAINQNKISDTGQIKEDTKETLNKIRIVNAYIKEEVEKLWRLLK